MRSSKCRELLFTAQSSRPERPVSAARRHIDYYQKLWFRLRCIAAAPHTSFALDNLLYLTLGSKSRTILRIGVPAAHQL
jgi:hypothetical protein